MSAEKHLKGKIFVIDDDTCVTKMIEGGLKEKGFSVFSFCDPDEGLRQAIQTKPDLIILDLIFPQSSGYDILGKIKTNSETKLIPVIVSTVKNATEDIQRGLDLGASDYIGKPIHLGLLIKRIETLLKYRQ